MHGSALVMLWQIAAVIDFVHALLMTAQILGLPLLFVHRWPRLTRTYAVYAIGFVTLSQGSQLVFGDCFLTTIAQRLWRAGAPSSAPSEWLTVRLAQLVFRATPTHEAVTVASEVVLVITAIGVLFSMRRGHLGPIGTRRGEDEQRPPGSARA